MLPSIHRLPLRKERHRVEQAAQRFSSSLFVLLVSHPPSRHGQPSRFAVLVSKKIDNRAVIRNRLRRQILASIQEFFPQISPGYDAIVFAKPALKKADYSIIKAQINRLLVQAHLLP